MTVVVDGPAMDVAEALRRVAGEPVLLALVAGDAGWSYLAWDGAAAMVPRIGAGAGDRTLAPAWDAGFTGGHIVQLDYEFPATAGRAWNVDELVSWDPAGRCRLVARDQAGIARLRAGLARPPCPLTAPALEEPLAAAWDAAAHRQRVERIRRWIADGDIYQANLTVPFRSRLAPGVQRDLALFLRLLDASPAPFSALLRDRQRSVISHSPELFLALGGRTLVSEPIKGTRRRGGDEARARADLLSSPKDRAELAMIVDLVRNDLGRVAEPGSVQVVEAARVMDLPYAHHLVARIRARLRAGLGLGEALGAAFPAGSITGAPKVRAMQIIDQLEAGPRGPYCGAFGWIDRSGDAQLAVAIRTLVLEGDQVRLDAGGGIVADSDPEAEWQEVRTKAAGMAAALGAVV